MIPVSVKKTSLLREPLPCNSEAETALQSLIWHSEALSFRIIFWRNCFCCADTGSAAPEMENRMFEFVETARWLKRRNGEQDPEKNKCDGKTVKWQNNKTENGRNRQDDHPEPRARPTAAGSRCRGSFEKFPDHPLNLREVFVLSEVSPGRIRN